MIAELILRATIAPRVRGRLLGWCGATIGHNVRVYEAQFINLREGFRNLTLEDDSHVGHGCIIDLEGPVTLKRGAVLAPGVMVLSHSDPGSSHHSPLADEYGVQVAAVVIGEFAWLGARSVVLPGVTIGDGAVVAAGGVVTSDVPSGEVWGGVPARRIR
jgi:acetyltransferase-like isoleucine patch superfamily enzyme